MITAEELVIELKDDNERQSCFKLGTVVDLFEEIETAKVQFDGEDTPSEKEYAYLDSYIPKVGDRVLLAMVSGTYIILGKVNYNISPKQEVDRYIFDEKKVIMQKGLNVSLGIETDNLIVNNDATIVGNVGVNGNVMATGISSSGNISAANIITPGTLNAGQTNLGETTLQKATINNTLNVSGETTVGVFSHTGTLIKFFNNSTYSSKRSISNLVGNEQLTGVINKVNEIINALKAYGLIG